MNPFYRLSPFIQDYIWEHRWNELRDVQVKAIEEIMDTPHHVLIAAGTASGKTEAAFFPMLTLLTRAPVDSFGILYIGPLKALINDQFQRIEALLDEADFPIYAWHGDRSVSEKRRAEKTPRGVLQITPEALEGLLMRKSELARRMFSQLQFVVIDELHAFMGTDRGLQLQCQLVRLDRLIGRGVRRVGLSATISSYVDACLWLGAGSDAQVALVESQTTGRKLDLAMQHYTLTPKGKRGSAAAIVAGTDTSEAGGQELPAENDAAQDIPADEDAAQDIPAEDDTAQDIPADEDAAQDVPAENDTAQDIPADEDAARPIPAENDTASTDSLALTSDGENGASLPVTDAEESADDEGGASPANTPSPFEDDPALARMYDDLYNLVRRRKCLVFTNSRGETESVVAALKQRAKARGEADIYYAHHGSLSAALRGDAESAMRSGEQNAVAVATRTLELGIDLGGLDRVVQLGSPNTCSSFVQRLGRTGRRGQPSVMRFLTRCTPRGMHEYDDLPWELIRSIAILQLYLEERWVEPFDDKPRPYSVLFHQLLSELMTREQTSPQLAKRVHTLPAFKAIPAEEYMALLRYMLEKEVVEKTETGTLIPGLTGEKLAGNYQFLSVFAETAGIRIIHGHKTLGEVDRLPHKGELLTLGGHRWEVTEVDGERRAAYVIPAQGDSDASWTGGGLQVHDRIVARMRGVLTEDTAYAYLRPEALEALTAARESAAEYDLNMPYTPLGGGRLLLHPWMGTRKVNTLDFLLRTVWNGALQVQTVQSLAGHTALLVETPLPAKVFMRRLLDRLCDLDAEALIPRAPAEQIDRYDPYIPPELLRRAYVYNQLDVPGLRDAAALLRADLTDALEDDGAQSPEETPAEEATPDGYAADETSENPA